MSSWLIWSVPFSVQLLCLVDFGVAALLSLAALPTLLDLRVLAIFSALLLGGAFNVELQQINFVYVVSLA